MSPAPLPRGLIEVSNLCQKNCLYCGIRRGNSLCHRYRMTVDEVLESCEKARALGYPAVALQAGEIESEENTRFYEEILERLAEREKAAAFSALEVTLSLGEQNEETYRRWLVAGRGRIMRYLLRIETSNPELYAKIHPQECSFERREECVRTLKDLGYVTGSGVMIGLPGQTEQDLERDLDWFERRKLDMIGMGPYVEEPSAPLGASDWTKETRLEKTLWMISEVRRRMPHVNIVAASALEALDHKGREKAFMSGANVYMPNITPEKYRREYQLYPGKTEV